MDDQEPAQARTIAAPTAEILAERYGELELALVGNATAALMGSGLPEGASLVSAETAIKLLTLRSANAAKASAEAEPPLHGERLRAMLSARIAAVRHAAAPPMAALPPPPPVSPPPAA